MADITAYRSSDTGKRPRSDTIRGRMYRPEHDSSQPETPIEATTPYRNNGKRARLIGPAAYLMILAACGGGGGVSPTQPTNPNSVSLQALNATTGQGKSLTYEIPSGSSTVTVSAADLANGLGDVVTSEFAVRDMGAGIGSLVMAAGSQANISAGNYQVFVPDTATRSNGQSVYDCMPAPSLNGDKRDFVVGVQHKPGVDTSGLPMRVWTDAIDELNRHMQSDSGTRYGSISFDPNASNPDFTVGFADNNLQGGGAWAEGYRNAFMAGPRSVFPLDYDRPTIKDTAIEELFEMIFRHNNICGPGTTATIGKSRETNDTEWGLNAVGVDLIRRNFTRAR